MPSKLENAERTLTWADFKVVEVEGKRSELTEAEKELKKEGARIGAYYRWGTTPYATVPGRRPPAFKVKDEIVVTVFTKPEETVVDRKALDASQKQRDQLLAHEQGHYDIAALLARDVFVDLVTLAGREFPDVPAIEKAVAAKVDPFRGMLKKVQDLYDDETGHGARDGRQKEWLDLIAKARSEPRAPRVVGRDSQPLRLPLLQAIRDAGKTLP
jgi:hypothetical protein